MVSLAMVLCVSPPLLLYIHLKCLPSLSLTLGIVSIVVMVVILYGVTMVVTVDLAFITFSLFLFPLAQAILTYPYPRPTHANMAVCVTGSSTSIGCSIILGGGTNQQNDITINYSLCHCTINSEMSII